MTESILQKARREAVQSAASQMRMVQSDEVQDAYNRGRWQGRKDGHTSEGRWWLFGVLCGIALSVFAWSFWL